MLAVPKTLADLWVLITVVTSTVRNFTKHPLLPKHKGPLLLAPDASRCG